MKHFLNFKIRTKLVISFIVVALIAGIVGAIGIINIGAIDKADMQLYQDNALGIEHVGSFSMYYQRVRYNTAKIMLNGSYMEEGVSRIDKFTKSANADLDAYNATVFSAEDKKLYGELDKNWKAYSQCISNLVTYINNGELDKATEYMFGDLQESGDSVQASVEALFEYNTSAAKTKAEHNSQLANTSYLSMVIVIISGIILAIILGLLIAGIISKPINKIVEAAEQLALGEVNISIQAKTKDETGKLMAAFSRMIDSIRSQALAAERIADGDLTVDINVKSDNDLLGKKLSDMVEKNNIVLNNIATAAEQVFSGAKQISDSSMALSEGATEQASAVEELTASLEQISSQTEINAQNANQASKLAEVAKVNAVEGNSKMKAMQKAMEDINKSSTSISKIIKAINEIAFQTNILALNAAVEAARAGQHGKGFAVVAEEVRNLAARSADAANETTDIIEGSMKTIEAGTNLANETASALNKIVEDVSRAAALVNDIAVASNEQAQGVAQVNQGIMHVSQVIQTNSATSEETAAASQELSSQSEVLSETVKKFKLKRMNDSFDSDRVDPKVLSMLDAISRQTSTLKDSAGHKPKIVLTDMEFGKY